MELVIQIITEDINIIHISCMHASQRSRPPTHPASSTIIIIIIMILYYTKTPTAPSKKATDDSSATDPSPAHAMHS